MQDKLKAMVERAIEKGYNIGNIKNCTIWFIHHKNVYSSTIPILVIDHTYTKSAVMRADEGLIESPPHIRYGDIYYYTLSDILFNREFMRALVGNGCTNFKDVICTEDRVCTFSESCETCEYYAPINTMLESAKLPTDQQRIDYVHGLIKGESE